MKHIILALVAAVTLFSCSNSLSTENVTITVQVSSQYTYTIEVWNQSEDPKSFLGAVRGGDSEDFIVARGTKLIAGRPLGLKKTTTVADRDKLWFIDLKE